MAAADDHHKDIKDLCRALLLLETEREAFNFLKDLCTPAELIAISERWRICKALNDGLSYREIHAQTGASLTTISRVARFLKDEPYQGYVILLQKLANNKDEDSK
jgi:TrpR-related protein YerC/YecD